MTIELHNHDPSTKRSVTLDIIKSAYKKKLLIILIKYQIKLLEKNISLLLLTYLLIRSGLQDEVF